MSSYCMPSNNSEIVIEKRTAEYYGLNPKIAQEQPKKERILAQAHLSVQNLMQKPALTLISLVFLVFIC